MENKNLLWLIQAKHKNDKEYEVLGLFSDSKEIETSKQTYLDKKQKLGFNIKDFIFAKNSCDLNSLVNINC